VSICLSVCLSVYYTAFEFVCASVPSRRWCACKCVLLCAYLRVCASVFLRVFADFVFLERSFPAPGEGAGQSKGVRVYVFVRVCVCVCKCVQDLSVCACACVCRICVL